MTVAYLNAYQDWYCPACRKTDRTAVRADGKPVSRFHTCPKLRNLSAPMLTVTTKAKMEVHEREDYIGKTNPQLDEAGRPLMNLETTRDDGTDLRVFAPVATLHGST
jgi:transposase InsO family protein